MAFDSIKSQLGRNVDFRALYQYRLSRIQAQLKVRDLGAVLLYEPQNIRYATDQTGANLVWSTYTPIRYCFFPADGLPVLFEASLDICPVDADELEFIGDIRPAINVATFYFLDSKNAPTRKWCDQIEELMREHCGGDKRLTVDKLPPQTGFEMAKRGFEILDGDGLMMAARLIKNEQEIQILEGCVEVARQGALRMKDAMVPGMTEMQLWAILHQTNVEHGGEWLETRLLTAGNQTNPWYQGASDNRLENGDLVVFDTDQIGPYGYVADISRTYICGDKPATDRQRYIYQTAHDNLHHNLELMRPGISFREIAEQAFVPPEEFSEYQEAVGHGAGVQIEYPLLVAAHEMHRLPYPEMVLQPGMVICCEAYIGAVGGEQGCKLEQQLVITEDGYRQMTDLGFEEQLLQHV